MCWNSLSERAKKFIGVPTEYKSRSIHRDNSARVDPQIERWLHPAGGPFFCLSILQMSNNQVLMVLPPESATLIISRARDA